MWLKYIHVRFSTGHDLSLIDVTKLSFCFSTGHDLSLQPRSVSAACRYSPSLCFCFPLCIWGRSKF